MPIMAGRPNIVDEPTVHWFTGICTPVNEAVRLITISAAIPNNAFKSSVLINFLLKRAIIKIINAPRLINTIADILIEAQKVAFDICINNRNDCPHGTANNKYGVDDFSIKAWEGKNNRDNDSHEIEMNKLIELTLYCFDRILYDKMATLI